MFTLKYTYLFFSILFLYKSFLFNIMHFGVIGGCLLGGFTAIIANYQNKSQENIQTSPQTVN